MNTRRWKRYPAYRDSTVEWLGEVPSHWEVRPLKRACSLNDEALAESTDTGLEIQYLDIGNVDSNGRINELQRMRFGAAPSRARRVVRAGDTVVSTVRTYLRAITHFESPPDNLIASTGFTVLRPTPTAVTPEFMAWASRSEPFIAAVIAHSEGVGYPAIAPTRLAALKLAVPAVGEQRAIAAFLDRETARIDALIDKKEELIRLLGEKRTALISHVVTKGLDPRAPMKDSGVPWLGDIPAHWEVRRLKHSCKLETGHTPARSNPELWVETDCVIPWVSLNDSKTLARVDVIEDTAIRISALGMANSAAHLIPAGAVVFTRDATIGLASILGSNMAVSQHIIAWVCGPMLHNWYLLYAMYAMRPALEALTAGATLRTIGMPDVNTMATAVPPRDEQIAIVTELQHDLPRFDAALAANRRAIDLLREQRQALITAAVTGQIDVREDAFA